MMKTINIFLTILFFLAVSCEKFLEENPRSQATTAQFNTARGQEQLINACYVSNKIWYGKEEGYDMSDCGTDIYTYAEQIPDREFFEFGITRDSRKGRLAILWVEFYKGVNTCNTALEVIEESEFFTQEQKRIRSSEVHFLRALYFYHLTEMWGRIAMPVKATNTVVTTIKLNDVNEVYDQILSDLNYAVDSLNPEDNMEDANFGRVTRDAALAFRARVNLTIASYIRYGENTPPYNFPDKNATDLFDQAYEDANTLITSENYEFYSNYADLWSLSNNSDVRNSEGIWAINYSRNTYAMMNVDPDTYTDFTDNVKAWDERDGGHHGHLMWGMEYRLIPGMERVLEYGRTFRRYMPTYYLIDLFADRTDYDARYHGQFRTVWQGVSDNPDSYPKWGPYFLNNFPYKPDSANYGDSFYERGDTALVIDIADNIPPERIAPSLDSTLSLYVDGPYFVLTKEMMHNEDGTINMEGTQNRQLYVQPLKFDDPERLAADGDGSERGKRDAYVFRLAEMYLIAAEAAVNGSTGETRAIELLKEYRASRAIEGYESVMENEIDAATIDKNFFLEERAREFIGEQIRWFDLKRTHTPQDFVDWIKDKNPDARVNMETHHYLYPYPSAEIDAVTNKNEFGDNNGYGL
jgi:starch-binding outer membrane protein, SusD/RagB family